MKLRWTVRFLIMTPLIMIVTILLACGGHGTNIPLLVCYPILFLIEKFKQGDIWTWTVMLIQFPIYGLLIDTITNHWTKGLAIVIILVTHAGQVKVAWDKRTGDQPTAYNNVHKSWRGSA